MPSFSLSNEQLAQYHADGFVIVEDLFDSEEVDLLRNIAKADCELAGDAVSRSDAQGGAIDLAVRNELGDDVYSAFVRCRRVVDTMEKLLGGEVYHYHHKMILKKPRVGGAWEWHQDYGYWYNNACLFPLLASCMIAVDSATKENGCLRVLRGSHLMGRVDHGKVGDQTGADPERVRVALERMEQVDVEIEPGSAVFFHCNLLHASSQNRSDKPRWALIGCYNAARNDPYQESRHPRYSRLEKWPDERIKEVGRRHWDRLVNARAKG